MVKKKRVVRKPVVVRPGSPGVTEELPPIQDSDLVHEVFHYPCEVLESEQICSATEVQVVSATHEEAEVLSPSTRLNFMEPLKIGDQIVAKLDLEEVEIEASYWKNAIVCIVLGANPPFKVFEGFINRVWGNLGIEKIVRMHSGFTLVNFRDEAKRDLVMESGVIQFDRKPVVLRPWSTDLDSIRMVKSVPVWVRLNGLRLQYWGKNNLSALVSTIGKPIIVDKVTQNRTMVKFSRVLVDMDISDNPPKTISFINKHKRLVEQSVEYEWLPSKCATCGMLGHTVANCNKEKRVTWKKKMEVGEKAEKKEKAGVKDNLAAEKLESIDDKVDKGNENLEGKRVREDDTKEEGF
ncbi:uncharacterized protein LOC133038331 [Cannabis sativa]|uniref:uncharacterized protein LOC133038331 n=1 Tax=Cannabis sativa TaxID=3483 RepID=UPI0029CA4F9B|nr:uncharacterized protein LOC133038331 [Cannabis sativa]